MGNLTCTRCSCPMFHAEAFRLTMRDCSGSAEGVECFVGGVTCSTCATAFVRAGEALENPTELEANVQGRWKRVVIQGRAVTVVHRLGTAHDGRRFWLPPTIETHYPQTMN